MADNGQASNRNLISEQIFKDLPQTRDFISYVRNLYGGDLVAVVATGSRTVSEYTSASDLDLDILVRNGEEKNTTKLNDLESHLQKFYKIVPWVKSEKEYQDPENLLTTQTPFDKFELDGYSGMCKYIYWYNVKNYGLVLHGDETVLETMPGCNSVPKANALELRLTATRDLALGLTENEPAKIAKAVLKGFYARAIWLSDGKTLYRNFSELVEDTKQAIGADTWQYKLLEKAYLIKTGKISEQLTSTEIRNAFYYMDVFKLEDLLDITKNTSFYFVRTLPKLMDRLVKSNIDSELLDIFYDDILATLLLARNKRFEVIDFQTKKFASSAIQKEINILGRSVAPSALDTLANKLIAFYENCISNPKISSWFKNYENKLAKEFNRELTEKEKGNLNDNVRFLYHLKLANIFGSLGDVRGLEVIDDLFKNTKINLGKKACDLFQHYKAKIFFEQKNFSKCIDLLKTLDKDESMLEMLGISYWHVEKFSEAAEIFGKILQKNPKNLSALLAKHTAAAMLSKRSPDLESKLLDRLNEDISNQAKSYILATLAHDALLSGDFDKVVKFSDEALNFSESSQKEHAALIYLNKGLALSKLGQTDLALEMLDCAIELDSKNNMPWRDKIQILIKSGRLEEASDVAHESVQYTQVLLTEHDLLKIWIGELSKKIKEQPANLELKLQAAEYYSRLREFDNVESLTSEILSIKPDNFPARLLDARAKGTQGKIQESIALYEQLAISNPIEAEVWNEIGINLTKLNKHEEALPYYQKALAIVPDAVQIMGNTAVCLANLNRADEAAELFDKALELDPKHAQNWNKYVILLMSVGKNYKALRAVNKSIHLDPYYGYAWGNKATILAGLGRYDRAEKMSKVALELEPKNPLFWLNRGIILKKLNRFEEALDCFTKVIELDASLTSDVFKSQQEILESPTLKPTKRAEFTVGDWFWQ